LAKEYLYFCPGCKSPKQPGYVIGTRSYSARRWELPYFMCGRCRLIYIDTPLLRKTISTLKKEVSGIRRLSYRELYKEMFSCLNGVVEYYCRTAGYKQAIFKRELLRTS